LKATAIAPANIAFIKYWGRSNHEKFLPLSTTNSMNLASCTAKTTVEFATNYEHDEIVIIAPNTKGEILQPQDGDKSAELFKTLERLRQLAGVEYKARVRSELNFPFKAGIASSAAGMAAFATAVLTALDKRELVADLKELSRQVRLVGSVSAARSVADGFTEAILTADQTDCYVEQIAGPDHWDLVDVVAVVGEQQKKTSTSQGHLLAETSPFLPARIEYLQAETIKLASDRLVNRAEAVKQSILNKDFDMLASLSETDALNMHSVMITSTPPVFYLSPGSVKLIELVWNLRQQGLPVFFTFDAGPNAHLITLKKHAAELEKILQATEFVQYTISNEAGVGVRLVSEHLF